MKKTLILIFIVALFGLNTKKAEAFNFQSAQNICSQTIDIPNSVLPNGPISYQYSNQPTITWLPSDVSGVVSYKIYKTPAGGVETLLKTVTLSNSSTYGGFGIGPAYHYFVDTSVPTTLVLASYRVEAYGGGNLLIGQASSGNFGDTCGDISWIGVDSLAATNITTTVAGTVTSKVTKTHSTGIRRAHTLSVTSIKNSSGIEILDQVGGIPKSSISFSTPDLIDSLDFSNVNIDVPSTLPTGSYTVTVTGTGVRVGGECGSSVADEPVIISGKRNFEIEVNCTSDNGDDFVFNGYASSVSDGKKLNTSMMTKYEEDYCGVGNINYKPGVFFCTTPIKDVAISTTFTLSFTAPATVGFDYKIENAGDKIINPGSGVLNTVTVTKTLGTAKSTRLYVSKILDSNGNDVFNKTNGISTTSSAFSSNPVTPNSVSNSNLTVNASNGLPAGAYTVFVNGVVNLTVTSSWSSAGVSGVCTTSKNSANQNILDCSVNNTRTLNTIYTNDLSTLFSDQADRICGAGNWTGTSPKTFSCTTIPPITNVLLIRTTAYTVTSDPYVLTLSDGPSDPCAVPVTSSINLSWNKFSNSITSYNVYRSLGTGSFTLLTSIDQPAEGGAITSYVDYAINPGSVYSYKVVAVEGGVEKIPSNTRSWVSKNPNPLECISNPPVTGSALSGKCSLIDPINNKPRWSATATGGVEPYTYTWDGGVGSNVYSSSKSLSGGPVTGPVLVIKDAAKATVSPSCADAKPEASALNLVLSEKNINAVKDGYSSLKVAQDENVVSFIEYAGIDVDQCTYLPTLVGLNSLTGITSSPKSLSVFKNRKLDTSTVGRFVMKITCKDISGNPTTTSTLLEVRAPAKLEEI